MGRWTELRLIATADEWFTDSFDYEGPACYELALAGRRRGRVKWLYVGETVNERQRISCYARSGSHLSHLIDQILADGWYLYYRGYACRTKESAKAMQDGRLLRYDYRWNKLLNGHRW